MEVRPLELTDRSVVEDSLRRFPPQISEHTFTNLYVWRKWRPVLLGRLDAAFCFIEERDGRRSLVGPALGQMPLPELVAELRGVGVSSYVRQPDSSAQALREAGLTVELDRDNSDYVYLREDLAQLAGRRYHRQRNLVNRCLSAHQCRYCPMTPDLRAEVAEMQDRWCAEADCGRDPALCAECKAIKNTVAHFSDLGLRGGVIRVGSSDAGRIEAYTLAEALNANTAVVHFEKAMRRYEGLYQVINQWFCQNELAEFELVNREQDLGIRGLRKAKRSYHPHHMVDKYVAADEAGALAACHVSAAGRCAE